MPAFLSILLSLAPLQASPEAIPPTDVSGSANFGIAVDIDGDQMIVGARGDTTSGQRPGSAHLYRRSSQGTWAKEAVFRGELNQSLGGTVAIEGDVAAMGSTGINSSPVVILERVGGLWQVAASFTDPSGSPLIRTGFGRSLDVADGRVVVGAYSARDQGRVTGAVYVYGRSGGSWALEQRIQPPPNPTTGQVPVNTWFGLRVRAEGPRLAVGAPQASVSGVSQAGRVTVWERVGGSYVQQATIPSPLPPGGFRFGGFGLALAGDQIAVGAIGADVDRFMGAGAVHVFERQPGGAWPEVATIVDPAPSRLGGFGTSLAMGNDRLVIARSAYFRSFSAALELDVESFVSSTSGTWAHDRTIADPLEVGQNFFGDGMALDGDVLAIGAPSAPVGDLTAGLVHVGDLSAGWQQTADVFCGGGPCSCEPFFPWEGCGNSTKKFATLTPFGSPSVAADDLQLTGLKMPANVLARLLLSPVQTPGAPFGDGRLCLASPLSLAPVMTGADGRAVLAPGLVGQAASQLGAAGIILAGETWGFQLMYDEPRQLFPCRSHSGVPIFAGVKNGRPMSIVRGFNVTNALSVTFRP